MVFEKRYVKKIGRIFESLSVPMRLLDENGVCLVPEDGASLQMPENTMVAGVQYRIDNELVRPLDVNPPIYLVTDADAPGVDNLLILADATLMNLMKSSSSISSPGDMYRRVLRQEIGGADLIGRAAEHQIPLEMNRAVLLFQIENTDKQSAYSMLAELAPLGEADALVEMNRHVVALIKDMDAMDGAEELTQFAQAVQETLLEETGHTALVGVSDSRKTLAQLCESYQEAKRAIEVGRVFSGESGIFVFNRLMLERFLVDIPREDSAHYHSLLFNRKTAKLFNEEMLQTIEMFFHKDLNLSDTARQLYIHRNTLVYRLDKVQKQTGLDLRHFDDAVTFKILYELKKCGQEKPRQIL